MKKKNLKLSFKKETISNIQLQKIKGERGYTRFFCAPTRYYSCIECHWSGPRVC